MIEKVKVVVTFPIGANFVGNVHVDVYRRLIGFIKDLMCFNPTSKCMNCPKKEQCRYYQMTGENFSFYPGLLIQNNLFEKKRYKENEQKEFVFYFVGNNKIYKDYVSLFFEQLRQNLFGNFFYLNQVSSMQLEKERITLKRTLISTPVENKDFNYSYNQMALYYNKKYNTEFLSLVSDVEVHNVRRVQWNPIRLKTRTIKVNGYVYKVEIDEEIDKQLLEIGIGKYNFIGGGHIEIKT